MKYICILLHCHIVPLPRAEKRLYYLLTKCDAVCLLQRHAVPPELPPQENQDVHEQYKSFITVTLYITIFCYTIPPLGHTPSLHQGCTYLAFRGKEITPFELLENLYEQRV